MARRNRAVEDFNTTAFTSMEEEILEGVTFFTIFSWIIIVRKTISNTRLFFSSLYISIDFTIFS